MAAFRAPVCFINFWADSLPTSLLDISILLARAWPHTRNDATSWRRCDARVWPGRKRHASVKPERRRDAKDTLYRGKRDLVQRVKTSKFPNIFFYTNMSSVLVVRLKQTSGVCARVRVVDWS